MTGVAVRLYARNNGELAAATSDADGIAKFPGGLLRGRGGDEPFVVTAHGPDNDFNFLEIGRPAFDLSDRGVSGRPQPGPVDAFLYTDRGIYRPGETVELIALVRDDKADAMSGLPVGLRLLRPDGIEVEKRQLTGDRLGAYRQSFALPRDARIGAWRVELLLDPKAPPIGSAEFRVEDFVPPQLKVALAAADGPIRPGEAFPVDVDARYYYGAPGAGLAIEAEAVIALDDNPFPSSRASGSAWSTRNSPAIAGTSRRRRPTRTARRRLSVDAERSAGPDPPARRDDPGRRVRAERPRGLRNRDPADPATPGGDRAALAGRRRRGSRRRRGQARGDRGRSARLARSRPRGCASSCCARTGNTAGIRSTACGVTDRISASQPIEAGTIDVAGRCAGEPGAAIARRALSLGGDRSRERRAIEPAVSCRLVGRGRAARCAGQARGDARQAELSAGRNRQAVHQGAVCRRGRAGDRLGPGPLAARAEPAGRRRHARHPGRRVLGQRRLRAGQRLSACPTAPGPQQRGPGRAVGVAWLGIDTSARTLAPALAAPDVVRPRSPVEIPVKVAGLAAGEEAYVTLAAVDEAVLKLTEFDSPAPEKYYYGKRQLGVELRDLYGRLIDPRANAVGVLRSGGDSFAKRSVAGLPDKSSRVVALFSGIVRLDGDGAARIPFDIPDFQGQLRLMAVAFSAHKVGSATRLDDGARSGRDDGVVAALSRARRRRADRGHDQQPRRRGRRLSPEALSASGAGAVHGAGRPAR